MPERAAVAGVVALKHVEEQAARRLKLPRGLARRAETRKHESGNARNLAKLPPRHFGRIQRSRDVVDEVVRTSSAASHSASSSGGFVRRQQLESIVIGRHRERDGPNRATCDTRTAPRALRAPAVPRMDRRTGDIPPRLHPLDEKIIRPRYLRPRCLHIENRPAAPASPRRG